MGAKEKKLTHEHISRLTDKQRRFRINCGVGWVGSVVERWKSGNTSYITIKNPRPLHAAPEGWPDLAGWDTITVTQEMVGQEIAVFAGDEVKATGRLSRVQKLFRDCLLEMGGRFRVVKQDSHPEKALGGH